MALDVKRIASLLTEYYGISIAGVIHYSQQGSYVDFRPTEIPALRGFSSRVIIGWRTIESQFIPDTFSVPLVNSMGQADESKRKLFTSFARTDIDDGDKIELSINEAASDPLDYHIWPQSWSSFMLSVRSPFIVIDTNDDKNIEEKVLLYAERLFSLILSLLPLEEKTDKELPAGLPEGARMRVEVNRYERNRLNRKACIEAKGAVCTVCNFSFYTFYGDMGGGYIHVHHIVPVSKIGENYVLDPINDLVPVCPNCHAMLHKQDPPYTIDALKEIIQKRDTL
jgi:5-methylcytosine-specific restriction protein A